MSHTDQNCYDPGDQVRFSVTISKTTGAADPTTLDWRYLTPTAVETTGGSWTTTGATNIVRSTIGSFYVDFTIPYDLDGVWEYRWDATGNAQGSEERTFAVNDTRFVNPIST